MRQFKFNDNYSIGCQSCQQGKWVCIYLTYLCNAKCPFCPAPFKQEDKIISAFGDDPEFILRSITERGFNGISFSGGDSFLVFDRLVEWLSYFKKNRPNIYYWVYTNGLAVDEEKLKQLANAGLNEIRFNIAATGYNLPTVIDAIAVSSRLIQYVTVEIPSIPGDYEKLVKVLPILDKLDVNYLNLHEYILTPDDPRIKTAKIGNFILNKETTLIYDIFSLKHTEKIKQFCDENRLRLKLNNCSLHKKENQMLLRRLTMGDIFKKDHEILTSEGMLETFFVYPVKLSQQDLQNIISIGDNCEHIEEYFVHPTDCNDIKGLSNITVAKLSFLPPLSTSEKRKLFQIDIINTET